jgi:lipopolysaccharide export system protein LptC
VRDFTTGRRGFLLLREKFIAGPPLFRAARDFYMLYGLEVFILSAAGGGRQQAEFMMAMAATQPDDSARSAPNASQRLAKPISPSRAAEFHQAQHHSRRVRRLKLILPSLAAIMALGFFGYSYVSSPGKVDVDIASSAVSDGKLVMASPKLEGFTKNNLPYSMTASRALQNLDTTGIIELEDISATLPVNAENIATIGASKGIYDRNKNTLDISSEIMVSTTDGMVAKLKSAFIDLGKGDLRTGDAVDIVLDGTNITADSMTVLENGKVLVFEKRVRMQLNPAKIKTGQQANGDTNAAN